MNSGQRKTIQRLFGQPTPNDIPWSDTNRSFVNFIRRYEQHIHYQGV
jgi:hypothetical protein